MEEGATGLGGVLLGTVNVLFRPFPWEADGIAFALTAVEVSVLWTIFAWRVRSVRNFFRSSRRSRLMWLSLVFVLLYAVLLGLALRNLGIVARQRIHIFPFLLIPLAGGMVKPMRRTPVASTVVTAHGAR